MDQPQRLPQPEDGADLLTLIPTILLARFTERPVEEIAAMAGITTDDFTQSVVYRQIFGLGEAKLALRQLNRICGTLDPDTTARIQALPLDKLEALADALLDFRGIGDLNTWLAANA